MADLPLQLVREKTREIVPALTATLSDAIMSALPDDLKRQLVRDITQRMQNELVSRAYVRSGTVDEMRAVDVRLAESPVPASASPASSSPNPTTPAPAPEAATTTTTMATAPVPVADNEPCVVLWPSELGAYLDTDSFMTRARALGLVWERTNRLCFRAARDAWISRGRRPRRLKRPSPSSSDTTPHTAAALESEDPFAHIRTKQQYDAFCARATAAERLRLGKIKGKVLEDDTAACFERHVGKSVEFRNAGMHWRPGQGAVTSRRDHEVRPRGPITEPGPFCLMGEVDGWVSSEKGDVDVVVEFKLRMSSITEHVPPREHLQLQAYMAMGNVDAAWHVQREFGTEKLRVTRVARDREYWNTRVVPGMEKFVCDVRRLLRGAPEDEALRHVVLQACERTVPACKPVDRAAGVPSLPAPNRAGVAVAPAAPLPPLPPPAMLSSIDVGLVSEPEASRPACASALPPPSTPPSTPPPSPSPRRSRKRSVVKAAAVPQKRGTKRPRRQLPARSARKAALSALHSVFAHQDTGRKRRAPKSCHTV